MQSDKLIQYSWCLIEEEEDDEETEEKKIQQQTHMGKIPLRQADTQQTNVFTSHRILKS